VKNVGADPGGFAPDFIFLLNCMEEAVGTSPCFEEKDKRPFVVNCLKGVVIYK
jgi:hypothetical protein